MKKESIQILRDATALIRAHGQRDADALEAIMQPYLDDPEGWTSLFRALVGIAWGNFQSWAEVVDTDPFELIDEWALDFARIEETDADEERG